MSFYQKPELALRRALELESINQSESALTLLHDVLSSRRHRTWSPTYEQIMLTYLNLCLKLHKSREAKDGLHQYRNLSQSQAPGSLEKVIRYHMDQAEKKCIDAKISADTVPEIEEADDSDEFGAASPQAILLSTMSADPAKTQRDSMLLLPSLKFLWETYRTILDILKSNSKLEHVYHAAAMGALRFCRVYKRRTEFRRLCDMLRMHLGNLQKYGSLPTIGEDGKPNNRIRGWEGWTSEAIELHLQTRFEQLETASALHLYTEGFRTVEDIFNILQISNARRKLDPSLPPPKAKLMAAYYEKLTTLFWVSENYLFHAFAWYKYYTLCKEYNRGMSDEMKRMQASAVLLAALCIPPVPSASTSEGKQHGLTSTLEDDIVKEKMARMATLLGFHTRHPTREALLAEIRAKNIMDSVPPYLCELYNLLEENSDPLLLVEKARPLLEQLTSEVGATTTTDSEENNVDVQDNSLSRYVKPLTSVLLLKLLLNLSAAYHTVSLDFLKKLTCGLDMSFEQVETAIVHFTQKKVLSCRIDHRAGCLRFGDAELESDAMRSQLTVLAKQLESVCQIVNPPDEAKLAAERAQVYNEIRSNLETEHTAIIDRKNLIEKRKEEAERLAQEKVKADLRQKAEEEAASKAEEAKRLEREKRLREKEKMLKIQKEMENTEKKKYLQAMGRNAEAMTEEEISKVDTAALAKEHADKANKKREAAERKVREAAKRLDYLVRAVRIEELPLIKKNYEDKVKKDRETYEAEIVEKRNRARLQWEQDVNDKTQLESHSVFAYIENFENAVMESREVKYREICLEEDKRAEMAAEKEKIARARQRKEDEIRQKKEEEEARKAEEEARKAEEERQRKEEERRRKAAEEEKRRQAELARMQSERERKEKERQSMKTPPSKGLDTAGRKSVGGGGGGGGSGRYVPPSKRGSGGGVDDRGSRPSYAGDRGGGYGGGRYEGRSQQGGGDRWGSGRDRGSGASDRGGGDRRGSSSFGDRRDDRGGGNRRWGS